MISSDKYILNTFIYYIIPKHSLLDQEKGTFLVIIYLLTMINILRWRKLISFYKKLLECFM